MTQLHEPWWMEYRQRDKPQAWRHDMEMLIRASFGQVLKEYTENCSVGGVQHMCDPSIGWRQRLFRICIFSFMFSTVCYLLYHMVVAITTKPFIVNSESSTYPISEIDFPAVAFCNVNKISKKALEKYAKDTHHWIGFKNKTLKQVEQFWLEAGRLLDLSFIERSYSHSYHDVIAAQKYHPDPSMRQDWSIVDMMKTLAPSCSEMLVRCSWLDDEVDCNSIFTVRRTVRGHCCAFNYVLDYESAASPNKTIAEVKKQLIPGYRYGLSVVLDPMIEDYAYPINNFKGFDVLLFAPTHFADLFAGRMSHRIAEPGFVEFMELKSTKLVASSEVRKYPLSIRKCMFRDESRDEFNGMYSYSACIVRCKIKSIQSICKCTPYYFPAGRDGIRACTMEDLPCLNKYREKPLYLYPINAKMIEGLDTELVDSIYCPKCLPDCELTQHFTKNYKSSARWLEHRSYTRDPFLENINMTNKCMVTVYHPDAGDDLDQLDVVSYWYEFLSNIGGFAGALIGFSVISAVEIVYYTFVRFLIVLRMNYVNHY